MDERMGDDMDDTMVSFTEQSVASSMVLFMDPAMAWYMVLSMGPSTVSMDGTMASSMASTTVGVDGVVRSLHRGRRHGVVHGRCYGG